MSTAREATLQAIREALRDVPPDESPADVPVPLDYLRSDPAGPVERIELFVERVAEYRAVIRSVPASDLPSAIAESLAARNVRRLATPADLPADWLPAGVEVLRDPGLTNRQLDAVDGVLTGCALAIAQTGTIVLDGGPTQGRRALTLLPDYHLCIVPADRIVGVVPEAVARLRESATRPLTWISGPSATSDIELSRVEGVHGPRTLEVLVIVDEPGAAAMPGREVRPSPP